MIEPCRIILIITFLASLSGCHAVGGYVALHSTGITEATALMGGVAAGEQDVIGALTIKKDLAQP